jgi:hypothetical protein
VIRQILDALRRSGSVIIVLREQRVESLPYALLLLLADQVVDSPSAGRSRRTSESVLLVVLRGDLPLGLQVQRAALLLRFDERDQRVLRRSDLSSSPRGQAVEHAEVERANELKVRTWHLIFSSPRRPIGEALGSASGHPQWCELGTRWGYVVFKIISGNRAMNAFSMIIGDTR